MISTPSRKGRFRPPPANGRRAYVTRQLDTEEDDAMFCSLLTSMVGHEATRAARSRRRTARRGELGQERCRATATIVGGRVGGDRLRIASLQLGNRCSQPELKA
jgi:hypothetical protein